MKFYELIPLTAAAVNLLLTAFVLSRNLRSSLTRVYALWGSSIAVWNLGTYFLFSVERPEQALFWARFLQMGVIFLPVSLFHLCSLIAQVHVRRWVWFFYAVHVLLAVTLYRGEFIVGVRRFNYAYYSVAGPWFWVFVGAYVLSSAATMVLLYTKQRSVPPLHQARLRWLMVANGILIAFGSNDILPILGLDHYPGTNLVIFPFGSAAAIFYGIIVGYSVLQHQLLDIYVTFTKIAAHLVRFLFLFLLGLSLLLLLNVFAPDQFTTFAFMSALGVLLISAVMASVFFPRLFGSGDDVLERTILGDRFEYHDKIQGFVQAIPKYSETGVLLNDLHDLLVKTVQVRSYHIIMLEETTHTFSLFCSHPDRGTTVVPNLKSDSPIFRLVKKTKVDYLAFNISYAAPGETAEEREARLQLQPFGAEFCFPLFAGEEPFGLLLVGEKGSGEPYTPHDLRLLTALVKNLSLVLNQTRLQKQILLAQEMELLGRMSRGMAHDLNNLLTPVSTILQLFNESEPQREKIDELLPMALRNVGTMQAYIKEALFFSQNQTPHLQNACLDVLLQRSVTLLEPHLRRRQIEVKISGAVEAVAELDETMVQRLMGNLLSNAIDASADNSQILIDLQRLARTDPQRDWYRTRITDFGEGISRENLKRISTPYFTTKDRGDEKRGFGLGLAICRRIVQLHGGNLKIESQERRGTTVQVDLPSRQIAPAPTNGVARA